MMRSCCRPRCRGWSPARCSRSPVRGRDRAAALHGDDRQGTTFDLGQRMNSLPAQIYTDVGRAGPARQRAWGAALALVILILVLTFVARLFSEQEPAGMTRSAQDHGQTRKHRTQARVPPARHRCRPAPDRWPPGLPPAATEREPTRVVAPGHRGQGPERRLRRQPRDQGRDEIDYSPSNWVTAMIGPSGCGKSTPACGA